MRSQEMSEEREQIVMSAIPVHPERGWSPRLAQTEGGNMHQCKNLPPVRVRAHMSMVGDLVFLVAAASDAV